LFSFRGRWASSIFFAPLAEFPFDSAVNRVHKPKTAEVRALPLRASLGRVLGVVKLAKCCKIKSKGRRRVACDCLDPQPRIRGNAMFSTVSTKDKQHTPFNSWSRCKEGLLHDMKPWRIHDLRRIARSLMSRAGVSNNNTERVCWHTIARLGSAFLPHGKVRRV